MKKSVIILIIISIIFIGGGIYFYLYNSKKNSTTPNSNYDASRTSTQENTEENTSSKEDSLPQEESSPKTIETEIATYTTKIRTKYPERQNNITIACSTLNDTIVENGKTFSFCNTLGKATKSKGYEEANVFKDGKEVEALGGGKCQVSSTLYNAVLAVPDLKVVERHPHSGKVYYVPRGKDAAVSYGSYDFKFKNNTGSSIKIKASNTEDELKIQLLKLE